MKNNLRVLRSTTNISQTELAKRIGVSRETVCRIEAGKSNPSLKLAYKIALALGVTIEEVFVLEEKKILQ